MIRSRFTRQDTTKRVRCCCCIIVLVGCVGFGCRLAFAQTQRGRASEQQKTVPCLITMRAAERTGFQEASPYRPEADVRTDFVMAYGINASLADRLERWRKAGYVLHVMTGVAWGNYEDYLDGKFDHREHWDEAQVDAAGKRIMHGPTVPYMVPSVAFSRYLESGIRRAIDAGAVAVHLEEPEFWARGGFSKAFQREWRLFYRTPWERPDSSVDAQYRASRLKYYLYRRTLDRLCSAMKEDALVRLHRRVRFYVPTHSLLNYTQWAIVSPESSLLDLPGVDGYIAQVWTGTARTPNIYAGRVAERTFETAYLEYGIMQELVRGTNRRMWFLHDPIEDNPRHDWNDYRANYVKTLVASLLHPNVWHYEVAPWPKRVFCGRYPWGSKNAHSIDADYATTLTIIFNQLRDLEQAEVDDGGATRGVGIFLADSAMFQRAEPAWHAGVAPDSSDPTRATAREVRRLAGFYGLALPLLKQGIPVRPVQLDNVLRTAGYLDDYRVLALTYEIMKPSSPAIHLALADWVHRGGTLIYVGADTDPFHAVRQWWNQGRTRYRSPAEHLFQTLDLPRQVKAGAYRFGKGHVLVARCHPAYYSRSLENAQQWCDLVRRGVELSGGTYRQRNYFYLRRGPYVIAAVMDETPSAKPLQLEGRFVDLLDSELAVRSAVSLAPGRQAWLLDLDKVRGEKPLLLAAAGRVETWQRTEQQLSYTISSPEGVQVSTRLLMNEPPATVLVDGQPCSTSRWDAASKTLLIRHPGHVKPVTVCVHMNSKALSDDTEKPKHK